MSDGCPYRNSAPKRFKVLRGILFTRPHELSICDELCESPRSGTACRLSLPRVKGCASPCGAWGSAPTGSKGRSPFKTLVNASLSPERSSGLVRRGAAGGVWGRAPKARKRGGLGAKPLRRVSAEGLGRSPNSAERLLPPSEQVSSPVPRFRRRGTIINRGRPPLSRRFFYAPHRAALWNLL